MASVQVPSSKQLLHNASGSHDQVDSIADRCYTSNWGLTIVVMFQPPTSGIEAESPMKTINVDNLPEPVVHAMEAVVETLREQFHVEKDSVDPAKVKAAIFARRNAARTLNQDWENVDQETWATPPNTSD